MNREVYHPRKSSQGDHTLVRRQPHSGTTQQQGCPPWLHRRFREASMTKRIKKEKEKISHEKVPPGSQVARIADAAHVKTACMAHDRSAPHDLVYRSRFYLRNSDIDTKYFDADFPCFVSGSWQGALNAEIRLKIESVPDIATEYPVPAGQNHAVDLRADWRGWRPWTWS